jgi:uncharacterized RDD family membrane protein YckC
MTTAGIRIRALEGLVDLLVCLAILYAVAVLIGTTNSGQGSIGFDLWGIPALVGYAVCFIYFIVFEAIFGATIGKLVTRLRVVRERDRGPIGWGAAVIRNLFRFIDGFLFYLVGFVMICFSGKRQRLGDIVAGTIVIRHR